MPAKPLNPRRHEDVVLSVKQAAYHDHDDRLRRSIAYRHDVAAGMFGEIKHKPGWTPAPDYSKPQAREEYKGRDYEALTKAALRKPVGYWEDAPRGIQFGGSNAPCAKVAPKGNSRESLNVAPSTPTAPQPVAAEELYEPVGTRPVVGDRLQVMRSGNQYTIARYDVSGHRWIYEVWPNSGASDEGIAQGEFRILKRRPSTPCARAWDAQGLYALVEYAGSFYVKAAGPSKWVGDPCNGAMSTPHAYTELPAPEAQKLWAECCAALNLNPETGQPK